MTEINEEWVPMSVAAKDVGASLNKISRLASQGKLQTKTDPFDERVKLVNLQEVRRLLPPRKRGLFG